MKRFPLLTTAAAACFIAAAAGTVFGHAFVDHADPKVGSTSSTPPTQVRIWFSEDLESAFSTIEVLDSAGHQIDKKDCHVVKADKKLLIVSLPADLAAGEYKVVWKAVSTDTHSTHGDFKFTVKPK